MGEGAAQESAIAVCGMYGRDSAHAVVAHRATGDVRGGAMVQLQRARPLTKDLRGSGCHSRRLVSFNDLGLRYNQARLSSHRPVGQCQRRRAGHTSPRQWCWLPPFLHIIGADKKVSV